MTTPQPAACGGEKASPWARSNSGILFSAFLAGMLVFRLMCRWAQQVLARGILHRPRDLPQVAGLGVTAADAVGFEPQGWRFRLRQEPRFAGSADPPWTEKKWPEVRRLTSACCSCLRPASSSSYCEQSRAAASISRICSLDKSLCAAVSLWPTALLYATALAIWFRYRRDWVMRLYVLFAIVVTQSVHSSASIWSLRVSSCRLWRPGFTRSGFGWRWVCRGVAGYIMGLVASSRFDLPTGASSS